MTIDIKQAIQGKGQSPMIMYWAKDVPEHTIITPDRLMTDDKYRLLGKTRRYTQAQDYTPSGNAATLQENLEAALVKAVKFAAKVSDTPRFTDGTIGKPIARILENVLLQQDRDNNRLYVTTTNLEYAFRTSISIKSGESTAWGDINTTVDAKTLCDYIRLLPQDCIALYQTADRLTMKCGNDTSNFYSIDASAFPAIQNDGERLAVISDTQGWLVALKACASMVSKEDNRPILTGIQLNLWGDHGARLDVCDGYTLSQRQLSSCAAYSSATYTAIIPGKVLLNVVANLSEDESFELWSYGADKIAFKQGDDEYILNLIDGKYPDVTSIIPSTVNMAAEIDIDALLKALKGYKFDKNDHFTMDFIPTDNTRKYGTGKLNVSFASQEKGDFSYNQEICFDGTPLAIQFTVGKAIPLFKAIAAELPSEKRKETYRSHVDDKLKTRTVIAPRSIQILANDAKTPIRIIANGQTNVVYPYVDMSEVKPAGK